MIMIGRDNTEYDKDRSDDNGGYPWVLHGRDSKGILLISKDNFVLKILACSTWNDSLI